MSARRKVAAVVLALALAAGVVVFIKLHANHQTSRDTLEFAAAVIGGAGVIFGIAYGFLTADEHAVQIRRRRALELIDQLNARDFVRLRAHLEDDLSKWADDDEPDIDFRADLVFYLGLLEDLAVAIRFRDADEVVLYQSLSFSLPATCTTFKRFIEHIRNEYDDATLFEEVEALAAAWSGGKCYASGRRMKRTIEAKPIGSSAA